MRGSSIETIGVPNLCEHVPSLDHLGLHRRDRRALARQVVRASRAIGSDADDRHPVARCSRRRPTSRCTDAAGDADVRRSASNTPRADDPRHQPLGDVITELEQTEEARLDVAAALADLAALPAEQHGVGRGLGLGNARRPQAIATPPPTTPRPALGRGGTEVTRSPSRRPRSQIRRGARTEIAVDDSQLVDWQTDVGTRARSPATTTSATSVASASPGSRVAGDSKRAARTLRSFDPRRTATATSRSTRA